MASSSRFPSSRMAVSTVAASLGTCTSGVSCAYNGAQSIIEPFVNQSFYDHYGVNLGETGLDALWGALSAQTDIGAIFGSLMINRLSEKYGRNRTGLLINCLITILGSILQTISLACNAFELLFIGRFICGFSLGLACIVPIYMTECSLDSHRGFVGTLSTLCWYLWDPVALLLAQSFILGNEKMWPYLVGHTAIPAFFGLIVGRILPESPKYLHISKAKPTEAKKSLEFFHGRHFDTSSLLLEYENEHKLAESQPDVSLRQIFAHAHFRRAFFVSLMVILSLDIVGSDFVSQYSTSIFLAAGIGEDLAVLAALLSVLPGILAACLTLSFIEKIGRRPLILAAMLVATIANLLLTVSASTYPKLAVLGVILIKIAHDGGAAPVGHFIPGEVCPQASRSKTATVSWTLNWTFSSIVVMFFPILQSSIGNLTYLIFVVGCVVFFVWFWLFMPETNQRAVDKIVAEWVPLSSGSELINDKIIGDYGSA